MFYTPGKLDAYVGMSYTSAVDPDKADGVKVSWRLYACAAPMVRLWSTRSHMLIIACMSIC